MKRDDIENLVRLLPKANPWSSPGSVHPGSKIEACELALRDPGFGWRFAKFHVESGRPLDASVVPLAIWRAYRYLLQTNLVDVSVALTEALNLPESKPQGDLLRALLLCKDSTPESIAEVSGLAVEVIMLFEGLFWNCWDRRHDRVYLGRICRQVVDPAIHRTSEESEDLGLELLRIVWETGSIEAVLAAAGVAAPKEPLSIPQLLRQFRKTILTSVAAGLRTQNAGKESPALKLALKMAAANLKEGRVEPLQERPSISEAVQRTINRVAGIGKTTASYEI